MSDTSLNTNQIASKLFKKTMGVSETNSGRSFFEEPILGRPIVYTTQVWEEYNDIPYTAPTGMTDGQTIGVIKKYLDLPLLALPGTADSYYSPELADAIPFNFDSGGSYNYVVKDSLGSVIPFGQKNWVVDNDSGVIMFYAGSPSNMPPKISFYKYVGTKGVGSGVKSGITYLSGLTDVTISGLTNDQYLIYSGGTWVNFTQSQGNRKIVNSGETIVVSKDYQDIIYSQLLVKTGGKLIVDEQLVILNGRLTIETGGLVINPGNIIFVDFALKNHNHFFTGLTDVSVIDITDGQYLQYSGGSWKNVDLGDIQGNIKIINSGETITVTTDHQSLIYGDLLVKSGGTLVVDEELVIINGGMTTETGGSILYSGNITFVDLSLTTHTHTLNSLSNVNIKGIIDDQSLVYSGGTWKNSTISSSYALSGLTDVTLSAVTEGQLLIFTGGTWKNSVQPTIDLSSYYTSSQTNSNFLSATTTFSLSGSTDVNIISPIIGETLTFDGSKWINTQGVISTKLTTFNSGTTVIDSYSSTTYNWTIYDYVVYSGDTNTRAGNIKIVNTSVTSELIETTTIDIGTTYVNFSTNVIGGEVRLIATSLYDGWSIKLIRSRF